MRLIFIGFPLLWIASLTACNQPLETTPLPNPVFNAEDVERLTTTQATNQQQVLDEKRLWNDAANPSYLTRDPYHPLMKMAYGECLNDPSCEYSITQSGFPVQAFPANKHVYDWWTARQTHPADAAVCGLRFLDEAHTRYELSSFENIYALQQQSGFQLTHYQSCGACSTLQDLAIYGSLDLTVMAKTCSKRGSLQAKKSCMQEIGFTEACAESWAYNGRKTSQSCALVCVNEYGLLPLLTGTETVPPTNELGELNACLLCDERLSGPGFQYSAGRTRRNSGIESEITRPNEEVYSVQHIY